MPHGLNSTFTAHWQGTNRGPARKVAPNSSGREHNVIIASCKRWCSSQMPAKLFTGTAPRWGLAMILEARVRRAAGVRRTGLLGAQRALPFGNRSP